MERLFRGTRIITIYEEVEIFAKTYSLAKEMIEDDDEDIKMISERSSGYECVNLIEVKE